MRKNQTEAIVDKDNHLDTTKSTRGRREADVVMTTVISWSLYTRGCTAKNTAFDSGSRAGIEFFHFCEI